MAREIGATEVTFELDRGGGGGRALRIGGFELRDAFKETFAELALLRERRSPLLREKSEADAALSPFCSLPRASSFMPAVGAL